ncbi:VOC family protein [Candidatus Poriferisodalis sp.]|uniref:VOC family protein n=1 Tax=Candidatus Poriferisodalis sp. TaxID=3101277 RepID=UPI003B012D70
MLTTLRDDIVMDHVAVVSERAWDNVIRYGRDLGGRWIGGPDNDPSSHAGDDFYFCQMVFDAGTKIEILEPIECEGSDFLRRYLARNGPGPHHFTFKTPDFRGTIGALAAAGYQVIGVNEDDPDWKEAFLHPKDSWGIVIQVAWDGGGGWADAPPLPPTRHRRATALAGVVHLAADAQAAASLFEGPLGMEREDEGKDPNVGTWVTLRSGPWYLRVIQPTEPNMTHWMGNRPGRLQLLHFEVDDPGLVPGAQRVNVCGAGERQEAMFVVQPEHNLGVRLLLTAHA